MRLLTARQTALVAGVLDAHPLAGVKGGDFPAPVRFSSQLMRWPAPAVRAYLRGARTRQALIMHARPGKLATILWPAGAGKREPGAGLASLAKEHVVMPTLLVKLLGAPLRGEPTGESALADLFTALPVQEKEPFVERGEGHPQDEQAGTAEE
jgi:predicted DNA-binding transcriptional regulator AlpA